MPDELTGIGSFEGKETNIELRLGVLLKSDFLGSLSFIDTLVLFSCSIAFSLGGLDGVLELPDVPRILPAMLFLIAVLMAWNESSASGAFSSSLLSVTFESFKGDGVWGIYLFDSNTGDDTGLAFVITGLVDSLGPLTIGLVDSTGPSIIIGLVDFFGVLVLCC